MPCNEPFPPQPLETAMYSLIAARVLETLGLIAYVLINY